MDSQCGDASFLGGADCDADAVEVGPSEMAPRPMPRCVCVVNRAIMYSLSSCEKSSCCLRSCSSLSRDPLASGAPLASPLTPINLRNFSSTLSCPNDVACHNCSLEACNERYNDSDLKLVRHSSTHRRLLLLLVLGPEQLALLHLLGVLEWVHCCWVVILGDGDTGQLLRLPTKPR